MPDTPETTHEAYERYCQSVIEQRVAIGERVRDVSPLDGPQAMLEGHYLPYLEGWLLQFTKTDLDTFLHAIEVFDDGLASNNCNPTEDQWRQIDETIARTASIGVRKQLTPQAFALLVQEHNAKKQRDAQREAQRAAQRQQRPQNQRPPRPERQPRQERTPREETPAPDQLVPPERVPPEPVPPLARNLAPPPPRNQAPPPRVQPQPPTAEPEIVTGAATHGPLDAAATGAITPARADSDRPRHDGARAVALFLIAIIALGAALTLSAGGGDDKKSSGGIFGGAAGTQPQAAARTPAPSGAGQAPASNAPAGVVTTTMKFKQTVNAVAGTCPSSGVPAVGADQSPKDPVPVMVNRQKQTIQVGNSDIVAYNPQTGAANVTFSDGRTSAVVFQLSPDGKIVSLQGASTALPVAGNAACRLVLTTSAMPG